MTNVKLKYFLIFLFIAVLVLRINLFLETILLFGDWIRIFFNEGSSALNLLNTSFWDNLLAITIFLAVFILIVAFSKKYKFLNLRLDFTGGFLSVLLFILLFAPILKTSDPDFQYSISSAKLLPPLSSKKIILLSSEVEYENQTERFIQERNLLLKSFSQTEAKLMTADSVHHKVKVSAFVGGKVLEFANESILDEYSKTFLFGTDQFGRDIYSRIIYGARVSLFIGFGSVALSFILGFGFGFVSGFYGGITDKFLNRVAEMFLAFPLIFLIILITAFFGNSLFVVILALGFSGWMSLFKIIRGEVINLKNKDFIISSKMIGFSELYILKSEMLPLLLSPLIVNLVLQYGNVILAESALSYLGLGIGNHYPSWGAMIENGQYYLSKAWWISLFPSVFLFFTLLMSNSIGKKLEYKFSGIK